ncbi:sensor histidine kinase [Paenibacillus oceani]|uniref:histidine kinase n=1 Tax=Paenibacillus oceani TaxID=2772510 RepID=A0A927GYH0_9BACL|nr:HAMP domain-containing histidine kinase [Paenibacillus oceani]MBD2861183.1 HAMP domain-containing histidine kinase [Paenibacillus oceani]
MSLRVRLMVLSSAWLVFILVLFSGFLYWFVINITTKSEKELMLTKAKSILENKQVLDPKNWRSPNKLFAEFHVSDEMIRIVGMDGKVKVQLLNNEAIALKPPQVVDRRLFLIKRIDRLRYMYVLVPIQTQNEQIGVLEIGRLLHRWNDYMDVLLSAIVLASVGAVMISVIGSFFYSRFIFLPLRQLYNTMHMIQQSGTFRKLDDGFTNKTDELGKIGTTFNEMIARLEEQVLKQKRFVVDASHELRTPLTIIASYADMLRRWGGKDPALRDEAVEAIQDEANRLKGLVEALMQLADTEREDRLKPQPMDMLAVIRAAAAAMEIGFQRRIEVECEAKSIPMTGDPEKLRQLLIILLDNAVKYSSKPVRIRAASHEQTVRFEVEDRGIGFEEKELPYIFDRFYRVDHARERHTGGFGLGLSIAKNIVSRHGGTIAVRSRLGAGTRVAVSIPLDSGGLTAP